MQVIYTNEIRQHKETHPHQLTLHTVIPSLQNYIQKYKNNQLHNVLYMRRVMKKLANNLKLLI